MILQAYEDVELWETPEGYYCPYLDVLIPVRRNGYCRPGPLTSGFPTDVWGRRVLGLRLAHFDTTSTGTTWPTADERHITGDLIRVWCECVGGGGAGGGTGGSGNPQGGGGGGGANYLRAECAIDPTLGPGGYTINVGTGGAPAANASGGAGGFSQFYDTATFGANVLMRVQGGQGGVSNAGGGGGGGPGGASVTTGAIGTPDLFNGGTGSSRGAGNISGAGGQAGGQGGVGAGGGGANANQGIGSWQGGVGGGAFSSGNTNGAPGSTPGGAGGGSHKGSGSSPFSGGAGAVGEARITWGRILTGTWGADH